MSRDLHAEILERIEALERLARRSGAGSPQPWTFVPGTKDGLTNPAVADLFGHVRDADGGMVANGMTDDLTLIAAAADPATVLRGLAEDRDILKRHRPGAMMPCGRRLCLPHDIPSAPFADECPEVLSVARRRGIKP